jgi:hypothetical protein
VDTAAWMEGNQIVVHGEWRVPDEQGPLTDPTNVVFTARRGVYELRLVPAPGVWRVHVQGTGAAHAADEIAFRIENSGALA